MTRQRLDVTAEWVKAVCDFIKTVSIHLVETAAFLWLLYTVGKTALAGL
jgi:hypothetical protein